MAVIIGISVMCINGTDWGNVVALVLLLIAVGAFKFEALSCKD